MHVSGRGRWGVFLDAKAGSSDAWQLYIVKTAEAARAVENETLCFPKLTRGCDAYVFSENESVRLDFQGRCKLKQAGARRIRRAAISRQLILVCKRCQKDAL